MRGKGGEGRGVRRGEGVEGRGGEGRGVARTAACWVRLAHPDRFWITDFETGFESTLNQS